MTNRSEVEEETWPDLIEAAGEGALDKFTKLFTKRFQICSENAIITPI